MQVWIRTPSARSPGDGGGDRAVAQVAHGARLQREHAAEADAHPAAGRHQHAGAPRRRPGSGWRRRPRRSCRLGERDRAALAGRRATVGRNRSVCRRSGRRAGVQCSSSASSRPAGPQAQVSRSARSGTRSSRSATSSMPSASVCRSTSRIRPAVGVAAQLGAEDHVVAGGRGVQQHDVGGVGSARENSCAACPITGVMPVPAVTNSSLGGHRLRQHEVAVRPGRAGPACPASRAVTRWLLTLPSGIALTVIADAAVGAAGREVRE